LAGNQELHERELEIINMIYASVMGADELVGYLPRTEEAAA
jgi:biuret amidohydrolase